ncbi:cysteine hydrolase [Atopobacter sp. AH10]|nr:cysteine hydrolase [Atopobacter sp. AH10]
MVYDFVNPLGRVYYEGNRDLLEKVNRLILQCKDKGMLIIYLQHSHRRNKFDAGLTRGRLNCMETDGGDALDPSLPINQDEDFILKKRRYSGFAYTDLDLILKEHGINKIYICGTKTNNCVRSTVEDGYHLGYDVWVIKDCVATNDPNVNQVHLQDIDKYYGHVVSSTDLLGE